ncbi:MAG: glycosyltransferase family 4 protein [Bacteroidetes bacterium]|nr:glycosyltransferase family 4 protein [Bacteroidota bacterium]
MKLWLLSDTAAPHTLRWARWFANRGHEVHVVSLNPIALPGYDPVYVHPIWTPRFGNSLPVRVLKTPIVFARLRALFKSNPPDVVHAHSAGGYAWLTMLSGFRPYIITPWGTDLLVDVNRSPVNRWITGQALRRAALVTTDGFHFIEILRGFGIGKDNILLHTFGTDIHYFCPGKDDGERNELGVGDAPLVISTRTPNPVHDVETFVRAVPKIQAAFPSARFIVVGDGADRSRLEVLAMDLGVGSVTQFVRMVNEDRMRRLLRVSDVYVSTSMMDAGLAASTAEAMAMELPVVQTANSDNSYWTPDGDGGFLFANSDHDALSSNVCRLLGDATMRCEMGQRNRRMIVSEYNMDMEMSRIEEEYERLIKRAQQRR